MNLSQVSLRLWAKKPQGRVSTEYHPLICHMIDVSSVAWALWGGVLSPALRHRISSSMSVPEDTAGLWGAFWAGLHDLGKASPVFQGRDPDARAELAKLGLRFPLGERRVPHGNITTASLRDILREHYGNLPADLASQIATIVGGHHGIFPHSSDVHPPILTSDDKGSGPWSDMRLRLVETLAEAMNIQGLSCPKKIDNATAMELAGLVSVADWIGSNADCFPYAVTNSKVISTLDLPSYAAEAKARAQEALRRLGWTGWSCPGSYQTFNELFPKIQIPYPVQEAVVSIAPTMDRPGLVVIEAPMGEGKTEAAMYLSDYFAVKFGQSGVYFALPTQATSNQMFGRVRDFLVSRYPDSFVNLQLLHGHASLSAEFEALRRNADSLFEPLQVYDEPGAPSPVGAAEWFTHRKRGLLAPMGVGTIDQALLTVLQTRHVFVRLFGLAHKTVIIDEVHAYDAYMTTLLERLLSWLGALGSSVVLLSATLPRERRDALVKAYSTGADSQSQPKPPAVSYPRVTWAVSHPDATHVTVSPRSTKVIRLHKVGQLLPGPRSIGFVLGERLKLALSHGGCAAVICNTVSRAQQVYVALKPYFRDRADDGEPELGLLHARYLFGERDRREKLALLRFGKPGGKVTLPDGAEQPVYRPKKAVLVATQIIEQSLDLDFDLMVTDMAPADLVLQRAGRLHRHDRARPTGLEVPDLWLGDPEEEKEGVPAFDKGTEAVYDPHILLRSWLTLKDKAVLRVPEDVEEVIEAVYDDRPCLAGLPETVCKRWEDTRKGLYTKKAEYAAKAKQFSILPPDYPDDILEDFNRELEEDDPGVHLSLQALTRLADQSVSVVVLMPEQLHTLDLRTRPEMAETRRLLISSVAISARGLVQALTGMSVPTGWQQSALLRHHRLVQLDAQGEAVVGSYQLRLDPELGVVITRRDKEAE